MFSQVLCQLGMIFSVGINLLKYLCRFMSIVTEAYIGVMYPFCYHTQPYFNKKSYLHGHVSLTWNIFRFLSVDIKVYLSVMVSLNTICCTIQYYVKKKCYLRGYASLTLCPVCEYAFINIIFM